MNFELNPEQLELQTRFRELGASLYTEEEAQEADKDQRFSRDRWSRCTDAGLLGLNVAPEYGGQGLDYVSMVASLIGFGEGCLDNGLPCGVASQLLATQQVIAMIGSDEQKTKFLKPMVTGEIIGAFAITEPDSGSDTYGMKATARLDGDEYVLDGHKCFITLAPEADIVVIFANTRPGSKWGVTPFIVPTNVPGIRQSAARSKAGIRSVHVGDFILEGCRVPVANRLGAEGSGTAAFMTAMNAERAFILSTQLGTMKRQLRDAIAFASQRQAFDRTIGEFQSVANRLVDMQMRLTVGELLMYKAAWKLDRGEPIEMDAALSNLHVGESFVASSLDSIRTFGARGYLTEFGVERNLRDSLGAIIYSGTSDVLRNVVARLLGL